MKIVYTADREIIPGDEVFADPDNEDLDFFDDDETEEEETGDADNKDDTIPADKENGNPFDEPKEMTDTPFPVFEEGTKEKVTLQLLPASVTALFIPPETDTAYRNASSWESYRKLLTPFSPAKRK